MIKTVAILLLILVFLTGFIYVHSISIYGRFDLVRAAKQMPVRKFGTVTIIGTNEIKSLHLVSLQNGLSYLPDTSINNTRIFRKLPAYGGFRIVTRPENLTVVLVRIE